MGLTSMTLLFLVTLWLVLLIWDTSIHTPIQTQAQAAAVSEERLDPLFYLNYANAVIFTIVTTAWMTGLYMMEMGKSPWMLVGLMFVPVYTTLNLVAYGTQITVVPTLVQMAQHTEVSSGEAADFLLSSMLHLWRGSIPFMLNSLAYAILGMPLIIFGLALTRINQSTQEQECLWVHCLFQVAWHPLSAFVVLFSMYKDSCWGL